MLKYSYVRIANAQVMTSVSSSCHIIIQYYVAYSASFLNIAQKSNIYLNAMNNDYNLQTFNWQKQFINNSFNVTNFSV